MRAPCPESVVSSVSYLRAPETTAPVGGRKRNVNARAARKTTAAKRQWIAQARGAERHAQKRVGPRVPLVPPPPPGPGAPGGALDVAAAGGAPYKRSRRDA